MLERAAQRLGECERASSSWPLSANVAWEKADKGYKDRLRHNARNALRAAFDPTDETLVRDIGRWIALHAPFGSIDDHQARDCARRMLAHWHADMQPPELIPPLPTETK